VSVTASHCAFRREGEYWTIVYRGTVLRLRDVKGLRYLVVLLSRPGERVAAVELMRQGQAAEPAPQRDALLDVERARSAVTKRIKSAIQRITYYYPALGYHLTASIRTGAWCVYQPDPAWPVEWAMAGAAADGGSTPSET